MLDSLAQSHQTLFLGCQGRLSAESTRLLFALSEVRKRATAAESLATTNGVSVQPWRNRHSTHADWALLPRRQVGKRPNVQLFAEIELASTFIKNIFDDLALLPMFLAVLALAFFVAIPNTLAGCALLEGVALLAARRTHLGCGPIFLGGALVIFGTIIVSLRRFAER